MESRLAPVTLSEIAAEAGVSLATASRAINGSTRTVNPELRERVLAVASALGYSPNAQAQAMARGTNRTIAMVVGDISDPYFSAIASGVIRQATLSELVVTMASAGTEPEQVIKTVATLRAQRPVALLIAKSRYHDERVDRLVLSELQGVQSSGAAVCFIGSTPKGFLGIEVNNRKGAEALAMALVGRGYRRFYILAGSEELRTARDRTEGFLSAVRSVGLDVRSDWIVSGAFSRAGAIEAIRSMPRGEDQPDCVFAVTDMMAVGAMTELRRMGVVPGRDIAFAGFDDIGVLEDVTPSLTTVSLPLADMGARALALALGSAGDTSARASGDHVSSSDPVITIDGVVALRESTPDRSVQTPLALK